MEEALTAPATVSPTAAVAIPARTGWRRALPWAVAVVLSVVVGIAVWNLRPTAPQPVTRTAIPLPPEESLVRIPSPSLSLSTDGSHIAYVARSGGAQQLYLRAIDSM